MKFFLKLSFVFFISVFLFAQNENEFIRGVDISFTPQIEDLGGKFKLNGETRDLLDILKEKGVNYVRLRLWHTPSDGYCGLEKTLEFAKRIKATGFKFLLDFHYSDWWADPGKQNKPAAWKNLPFENLKDSVYGYTKFVLNSLKNHNALPDMVQIGNEITGGMLWPDGKLYGDGLNEAAQWIKFTDLLKEGIRAVKDVDSSHIKIMIHIDKGGNNSASVYFYNQLNKHNVEYDVIGLSFYPWWHGSLEQLEYNLNDLAARFKKEIIVAETAYPWTLQYQNDGHGNIFGPDKSLLKGFPATPRGQKDFLIFLKKIIKETRNGKAAGFFYWEPAYISVPPIGSSWENLTVFGFTNSNLEAEALESINAFLPEEDLPVVNVTVTVNTSTLADTLKTSGIVQLRGEVKGKSSSLLPDGKRISWDSQSELILKNIDGDYWRTTFQIYEDDSLEFKIWTGHTLAKPTRLRAGFEGPVSAYDGSGRNIRLFIAGGNDTILPVQFFNSTPDWTDQYYNPIQHKEDSIGVMFRVNLAGLVKNNLFDPNKNQTVAVRGDSIQSGGILSWKVNKLELEREIYSADEAPFYSGVIYFPKDKIEKGRKINYKFYVEGSSFGGWESGVDDRFFYFPENDTTLHWKFFNDNKTITGLNNENNEIPKDIVLYQNYPNPFNPSTTIEYSLSRSVDVNIGIYNVYGELIKSFEENSKPPGRYSVVWRGDDNYGNRVSSGVYFLKLTARNKTITKKLMLLK